jgi:oligoendopeptidase F
MEFFTWPWMERFFGRQTDKYRLSHLAGALTFLPYGAEVDEFQHLVYENPEWSPARRNAAWLELESKYRPWLRLEGLPFFGEGRGWQVQAHIYERPFYYIDYCLAQTAALAFWAEAQKDHAGAWQRYFTLVRQCGRRTFTELLDIAGLRSVFTPGTLRGAVETAADWLSRNEPVIDPSLPKL